MALTYSALAGLPTASWLLEIVDLYAVVYAEPPYREGPEQVRRFADGLPGEAMRPGFTLVTAEDEGALVGATYGWTMPAGRWWSRTDQCPPTDVLNADKFAIMEWLVHPRRRGEGIGAGLIRRLLSSRPERWATLASNPQAAARDMYRRAGWRQVSASALPDGTPMDLLILELPASSVSNQF
ncbi:GNAT family N-acetyltransferase [Micromonospora sp. WMMD956]|uniref:GNAT family N-acetyltransferase n=1 Tax=Micromonospora sp. WMMD956 TaxID=3016108 RepID=UPI0024160531|nr:GNAT family N-acetyltransferase [Micromonospora sp. WMMD956]MDG4820221.1 GNAT family N-acetyltransferase [Micromonospora sp. WMMD956]